MHSARVEAMLESLRTRLPPYSRNAEARATLDGIRALRTLGTTGAGGVIRRGGATKRGGGTFPGSPSNLYSSFT